MEDFYDVLTAAKERQRLTNEELGEIVDMKAEAFRVAVKRQSLDRFQKEAILKKLEEYNIKKAPDENRSLQENEEERIVDYFIRNYERLKQTNALVRLFEENNRLRVRIELMQEFDRK